MTHHAISRSAPLLLPCVLWVLLAALICPPASGAQVQTGAANPNKVRALKPNLDLYVYRRCFTPREPVAVNLSTFNAPMVQFAAYPLDLGTVVTNSGVMKKFGKTLRTLPLGGRRPAASWRVAVKSFPDQWASRAVKAPRLAPGSYLLVATASARGIVAEKRTWIAVTQVALLAKRSLNELLVYACDVDSGRPMPNVPLRLADERGRLSSGSATGADGTVRIPTAGAAGSLWMCGATAHGPAFAIADAPDRPEPYAVFTAADRPVYRPGNLVQYKATIRKRVDDAAAPGGFNWTPYAGQSATVELRDPTDALVDQKTLRTDAHGALAGSLQLAPEPGLGEWHLIVVLDKTRRVYSQFSVQAYRKPEMTVAVKIDRQHYLGGTGVPATVDAQYVFGRPVVGARVHYSVHFTADDPRAASAARGIDADYEASGMTDASGQLRFSIPTHHLPYDEMAVVEATVTDLSRRSANATEFVSITSGLFQLSLTADKSVYRPGERIALSAGVTDYDGKPVPGVRVRMRMVEHKQDNRHRNYDETTTRTAVTARDGIAAVYFSTPREGEPDFKADTYDARQDQITADTSVQVTADKSELAAEQTEPTLDLAADKKSYKPGGTAVITINSLLARRPARNQAWALVTLEGEHLGLARVVPLTSVKSKIAIPLQARDYPSITLDIAVIQDRQLYEQQTTLPVEIAGKEIKVSITPDKAKYEPGDTAVYTVSTMSSEGAGVPADVSLGVVDSSIYQIAPDNADDMRSVFYGGQAVRITSSYSFAAQYSGGGYQVVAPPPAPAMAPPPKPVPGSGAARVRDKFADTAYWNAGVETGADGTAQVQFVVPDNLATWRATAQAITQDTRIGNGKSDVVSVMPLLVRLELPRFAVEGDHLVVSAIVQNGTPQARSVHVTLQPQGASADAAAGVSLDQAVSLPADGQQRFDWPVTIQAQASGASPAPAQFTVTADGGAGGRDAAQGVLPILPDGVPTVTAITATLAGADTSRTIDLTQLPAGAGLQLTLSSSLAAGVEGAVNDLAARPAGDAEETADALIADVAAARARRDAGRSAPTGEGKNLDTYVSVAVQKLYRFQHPDGGWNWWEFDQTDGDMTSYILSALAAARDAGFAVDDMRLRRGADALATLLKGSQDPDSRADQLLALSAVQPDAAQAPLLALYADRSKLGAYGLASLALGLKNASKDDADSPAGRAAADTAQELASAATVEGRGAFWPLQSGDPGCLWSGDDVTLTAHALRALLACVPDDPKAQGAARWLMANRDGGASWQSSRASAEAVLALTRYMRQTRELASNYTAHVLLDGQSIAELDASTQGNAADTTVGLTPQQLQGHRALKIEKQGAAGTLYVSQLTTSLIPPIDAVPQARGITVKREFRIAVHDPSHASSVPSGMEIGITLEIDADADYRYVKLQDRVPAGCEVSAGGAGNESFPIDVSDGDVGYTRQQTRDDRVEFYFDSLPKGVTRLTYHVSAETPGTYRILDADAALVYQPEVRGSTDLAQVTVGS